MTEKKARIEVTAKTPDELAAQVTRTGDFLNELGIAHHTLAGQELIDAVLSPHDSDTLHLVVKE